MSPTPSSASSDKSFYTDPPADLWLPFQFDPNSNDQGHYFLVAGRLKPGVTLAQANARMKIAADQFRRRYPNMLDPKETYGVQPLRDAIVSDVRSSLFVLIGAVELRPPHRLRQRRQSPARPRYRTQA